MPTKNAHMNLFTAGSSKMVTITEGELDALSVAQILKGSYTNPVVSLPSATPSKKLWENCKEWLDSFQKIVLSVDTDDAGNALADKIAKLFPNKVYRVNHHPYKDANDFLKNSKGAEFKSAWWAASKYTPENVMNTTEDFLSLYQDAKMSCTINSSWVTDRVQKNCATRSDTSVKPVAVSLYSLSLSKT